MVGQRLVVFASDDGKWFFKTHDVQLPDAPAEGHIAFQHEEHGNAPGVRIDNVVVWDLDSTFDMHTFAGAERRIGTFRPGSPELVETFSRSEINDFLGVHGAWRVENGFLWCPTPTSEWARIRSVGTWGDFMLTFKIFRQPSKTTNWAGVALRCGPDGIGFIRLILISGPAGHRLAVWPVQADQVTSENRAAREREAQIEQERMRKVAQLTTRWTEILKTPVEAGGERRQDVVLGHVRWKVIAARKLGNTLKSDNAFVKPKTTPGRFIYVEMEIENKSDEPLTFAERPLYDRRGRRYTTLSDASWYLDKNVVWLLKTINPNVPHTFVQVYEVPDDASGLAVGISNLRFADRKEGVIELGF
jgi:hypothetical protein